MQTDITKKAEDAVMALFRTSLSTVLCGSLVSVSVDVAGYNLPIADVHMHALLRCDEMGLMNDEVLL